jgi:hypothetical protein
MDSQGRPGQANGGVPTEIDTSKPHPARIYDYFLGGCFLYS